MSVQTSPQATAIVDARVSAAAGELATRFRAAEPFPHVVIDGFLDAALCRRLVETFPAYDDVRFRNDWGELGKAWREDGHDFQIADPSLPFLDAVRLMAAGQHLAPQGDA